MIGDELSLLTGCGIVTDSVPEQELTEARAKAKGLLFALTQADLTSHACKDA